MWSSVKTGGATTHGLMHNEVTICTNHQQCMGKIILRWIFFFLLILYSQFASKSDSIMVTFIVLVNWIFFTIKIYNYLDFYYLLYYPKPCIVYIYFMTCIRIDYVHIWCNTEHSKPSLVLIVIVKLLLIMMEFHLTSLA